MIIDKYSNVEQDVCHCVCFLCFLYYDSHNNGTKWACEN